MRLTRFYIIMLCLGLLLSLIQSSIAQPVLFEKPLSPRIANYDIDVRLETEKRLLHGNQVLKWYNKSSDTITELQFHLYLNAFRNTKSTFMKESGGRHRGFKIKDDGWGYIEINKIILPGDIDVTDKMEFIQPDDGNEYDKTVFRLPLPRSIKPGESIELQIDFTGKLPQPPFARCGAKDEYFFVGQWFPKIGVYIDGKWNCHQYHRNSEYFADYGVYNVKMTVPEENILGATGVEVEVIKNGDGTATHFYHAEDVHDFAWTTSPEFVEFKGRAQDVDIRVLMQKDHAYQGQRHLDAAKVAVEYFQNWYGDYPYPNLTVVDPRRGAMGSGGMEYPTLITAGTFYGIPKGLRAVEAVIIHEFGHNYWYHLVASNEFEEAWLDEGINSYSEAQIFQDYYGSTGNIIDVLGIKISDLQVQRNQYIFFPDLDPIVKPSWDYYSSSSYGVNSYQKPSLILTTLQNYLGKEVMLKIMRTYFERWKFKHPKTQDFIDIANEVSGQDLTWYFDQALFTNNVLDYSVAHVFTRKVKEDKGYDFTLSVADDTLDTAPGDSLASDDSLAKEIDSASVSAVDTSDSSVSEKEPEMYYSGVNIRRLGEFIFPVEVEIVFANGDTVREHWDGKGLWKKYRYTKPTKLLYATVDPESRIPIDINYNNNSKTIKTQVMGVSKLSVRWLFWMQFLLDQPDFLNLLSIFTSFN